MPSVAVRVIVVALGATCTATTPSPVPDAPDEIVTHAAYEAAFQVQLAPDAVTLKLVGPPAPSTVVDLGETVKLQLVPLVPL